MSTLLYKKPQSDYKLGYATREHIHKFNKNQSDVVIHTSHLTNLCYILMFLACQVAKPLVHIATVVG